MPRMKQQQARINYVLHDFQDGQGNVKIKLIRGSKLCKWVGIEILTIWNRIYIRKDVLVRKVFIKEMSKLRSQRKMGIVEMVKKFKKELFICST